MFTIESETDRSPAGGITVRGWVTNRGNEWVRGVVLIVQSFGASGQVTDETLVPVSGEIGPGTRRWFEAPAPPGGATVRVRVYSFEYLRRPSG